MNVRDYPRLLLSFPYCSFLQIIVQFVNEFVNHLGAVLRDIEDPGLMKWTSGSVLARCAEPFGRRTQEEAIGGFGIVVNESSHSVSALTEDDFDTLLGEQDSTWGLWVYSHWLGTKASVTHCVLLGFVWIQETNGSMGAPGGLLNTCVGPL